ncbi:MAG TPA: MFS transporter [Dehalococcoidia bacterium]|nr:MFS transporter [Dehalococcoidia bacterium]
MAVQPEDLRLLANSRFRRLMEARAVAQTGQNAMLYALLILVVNETASSIHSTLLVTAWMLPCIVLGVPAGSVADVLPKRALLVTGYAVRAALAAAMILYVDDVWTLYVLVLAFSSVGQVSGPAEAAALPLLVRRDQLAGANSWMVLSLMVGQGAGAVALAPIVLKFIGAETCLAIAALLLAGAALIVTSVTGLRGDASRQIAAPPEGGLLESLGAGWSVLRTSRRAFLALVYLTIVGTLAKALAVLAPHYTRSVLKIATENTVFVVAPAAIGALLALAVTPPLARRLDAARIAAFGFVLYVLGVVALGLIVYVKDFIVNHMQLGLPIVEREVGVSSVSIVTMAMILAIPIGFAVTVVGVAGKAVLNEEAPEGKQGRVFATQGALSDALSVVPLFAIGGAAELMGVRAVLLVAAVAAFLAGVYLSVSRRFGPRVRPVRAAPAGPPTST